MTTTIHLTMTMTSAQVVATSVTTSNNSPSQHYTITFPLFVRRNKILVTINPLTPASDQDRISPYNINQISDENKEKYQFQDS